MKYKKILGLDLGVASIGWSLIKENEQDREIIAMGTRVIPLDKDESDEFVKGNSMTKNQNRTLKRTQRKGYYRYTLRRKALTAELKKHGMFDENLFRIDKVVLWSLRSKAVTEKINLKELGRVLYHLNQKRGYKSSRNESNSEKKETEYIAEVKSRYQKLKEEGKTIGQKFYEELLRDKHYRIKQQIFPREAYIEEFDLIMKKQQEFYPEILNDDLIRHLRDDIIYFQRKLKSQKGLVSICDFEGFYTKNKEGKEIFVGPKVAHRSNPLFQIEKIWETINNISIKDRKNNEFPITLEQKEAIFNYLDNNEKLSKSDLFKILGISDKSGWFGNKMLAKGLQGNLTKVWIKKALEESNGYEDLLKFTVNVKRKDGESYLVSRETGEVLTALPSEEISADFINEPLYKLWHTIYSISDLDECKNALIKKFNLEEQVAERLARIDFAKLSYGNKSVKAIRKILPYLMKGYLYSDAASFAGYNHSFSLTKNELTNKQLLDNIPLLQKNSLRQPVVEKILNQMIHLVNDIIDEKRNWVSKEERENGLFEIRIELARELKQSKEERNETFKNINKIERENKEIEKRLMEMGLRANRKNIIKYRLFNEISNNKINAMCIYTGKMFSLTDALNGDEIDVEHIIPKSLLFDDSQSNKTLTFRNVNQEKGDLTAYDYMATKGEDKLNEYIERVNKLYKDGIISKTKRDKLLTPANKIPQDMIARQLRETQYVAKKAKEILEQISKNVWSTSGNIIAYLRRIWGWDDILMNLQIQRIKEFVQDPLQEGITEIVEWETEAGQIHKKEVLKNWSKRDDNRHHAIDALVVACTKQSYIQRINTLSSQYTREELLTEVKNQSKELKEKLSLLDKYLILQKPFTTKQVEEKAAEILISFKPGKKVTTYGKRFIKKNGKKIKVQDKIIVPRGALSEESIYGKIKTLDFNKPIKFIFENPHLIFKSYIKDLVESRLAEFNGDVKKAISSLMKHPIYLDDAKTVELKYATCFKEEYVIKYPINSLEKKDVDFIVDKKVKELVEERLKAFNYKTKEAFKEPLYFDEKNNIPIKTIRLFTGLSAVEPLKTNSDGKPISFVKPGNNHHLAIYQDENGNKIPHICTFWHAVERKKYGFPVIIDNPSLIWDKIIDENSEKYSEDFLKKLPEDKWKLVLSLQQNEMFLLEIPNEYLDLGKMGKASLSKRLFRVQKLTLLSNGSINIWFRHHLESKIDDSEYSKKSKKYFNIQSINALEKINPIKVKLNRLGEIETC